MLTYAGRCRRMLTSVDGCRHVRSVLPVHRQSRGGDTPAYRGFCYICVLILLYMCPHTLLCVSSYYYYICVLILYICSHTGDASSPDHSATNVSSYYYICVLILYVCPHTGDASSPEDSATIVFSYYYICVLILLYVCPHTLYVFSYR
jgi:hypothetical protein